MNIGIPVLALDATDLTNESAWDVTKSILITVAGLAAGAAVVGFSGRMAVHGADKLVGVFGSNRPDLPALPAGQSLYLEGLPPVQHLTA